MCCLRRRTCSTSRVGLRGQFQPQSFSDPIISYNITNPAQLNAYQLLDGAHHFVPCSRTGTDPPSPPRLPPCTPWRPPSHCWVAPGGGYAATVQGNWSPTVTHEQGEPGSSDTHHVRAQAASVPGQPRQATPCYTVHGPFAHSKAVMDTDLTVCRLITETVSLPLLTCP